MYVQSSEYLPNYIANSSGDMQNDCIYLVFISLAIYDKYKVSYFFLKHYIFCLIWIFVQKKKLIPCYLMLMNQVHW